jgi:hypothetical protein
LPALLSAGDAGNVLLSRESLNALAVISESNREFSPKYFEWSRLDSRIQQKISMIQQFQAVLDFVAVVS